MGGAQGDEENQGSKGQALEPNVFAVMRLGVDGTVASRGSTLHRPVQVNVRLPPVQRVMGFSAPPFAGTAHSMLASRTHGWAAWITQTGA